MKCPACGTINSDGVAHCHNCGADFANVHIHNGNAHKYRGAYDLAIAEYHQAIRLKPNYADAHFNLGFCYERLQNYDSAVSAFRRALNINPKYSNARYALATTLASKGDYVQAIAEYELVLGEAERADAYYGIAVSLDYIGKTREAVKCYRKALEINPKYLTAKVGLARSLIRLGSIEEAIGLLEEVIAVEPDLAEVHTDLAYAYEETGKVEQAIDEYRKAIKRDPAGAATHFSMALALMKTKHNEEAAEAFRKAMSLDQSFESFPDGHYQLGMCYLDAGNLDEAEMQFRYALELNPNYHDAILALGHVLKQRNNFEEAISYYRRAVTMAPEHADVHCALGDLLREIGDYAGAESSYQRALALNPAYGDALFGLGRTYFIAGRYDFALDALQRLVGYDPHHLNGHQALKEVYEAMASHHASRVRTIERDTASGIIQPSSERVSVPVTSESMPLPPPPPPSFPAHMLPPQYGIRSRKVFEGEETPLDKGTPVARKPSVPSAHLAGEHSVPVAEVPPPVSGLQNYQGSVPQEGVRNPPRIDMDGIERILSSVDNTVAGGLLSVPSPVVPPPPISQTKLERGQPGSFTSKPAREDIARTSLVRDVLSYPTASPPPALKHDSIPADVNVGGPIPQSVPQMRSDTESLPITPSKPLTVRDLLDHEVEKRIGEISQPVNMQVAAGQDGTPSSPDFYQKRTGFDDTVTQSVTQDEMRAYMRSQTDASQTMSPESQKSVDAMMSGGSAYASLPQSQPVPPMAQTQGPTQGYPQQVSAPQQAMPLPSPVPPLSSPPQQQVSAAPASIPQPASQPIREPISFEPPQPVEKNIQSTSSLSSERIQEKITGEFQPPRVSSARRSEPKFYNTSKDGRDRKRDSATTVEDDTADAFFNEDSVAIDQSFGQNRTLLYVVAGALAVIIGVLGAMLYRSSSNAPTPPPVEETAQEEVAELKAEPKVEPPPPPVGVANAAGAGQEPANAVQPSQPQPTAPQAVTPPNDGNANLLGAAPQQPQAPETNKAVEPAPESKPAQPEPVEPAKPAKPKEVKKAQAEKPQVTKPEPKEKAAKAKPEEEAQKPGKPLTPAAYDGLINKGYGALDKQNYNGAISLFKQALAGDSNRGDAYMGLAEAYRFSGNTDMARKYYQQYLAKFPNGPEAPAARNGLKSLK